MCNRYKINVTGTLITSSSYLDTLNMLLLKSNDLLSQTAYLSIQCLKENLITSLLQNAFCEEETKFSLNPSCSYCHLNSWARGSFWLYSKLRVFHWVSHNRIEYLLHAAGCNHDISSQLRPPPPIAACVCVYRSELLLSGML